RHLDSGTTELATAASDGGPTNGDSFSPSIDKTGHAVAFLSHATNLVSDTLGGGIFLRSVPTPPDPGANEGTVLDDDGQPFTSTSGVFGCPANVPFAQGCAGSVSAVASPNGHYHLDLPAETAFNLIAFAQPPSGVG